MKFPWAQYSDIELTSFVHAVKEVGKGATKDARPTSDNSEIVK